MGTSAEQQHACAQRGIRVRSGEEANRTKQGTRGPPVPRQHELRLTKGAYSFPLMFCVVPYFSIELIGVLLLCA